MSTQPTDAEILELASQYWYSLDETESETEIELVRAALAKLGRSLQQEVQKPVAWWIPKAEQFALADKSGDRPFAKAWEPLYAIDRDALIDAIAQCLHGTWHCTRHVAALAAGQATAAQQAAPTRDLAAVIKGAADKLDAAVRCHPNAVDTLIHEALEILDGDREPDATPSPKSVQQAPAAGAVAGQEVERGAFEAWFASENHAGCVGDMQMGWMARAARGASQPAPAPSVLEDAARYQLLRRGQHWSVVDGIGNDLRAEALDAAVDAARKQGVSHER